MLYQNALYALLRPTRRAALSKVVAETLVTRYRGRSSAVASELAHLFEAAREFNRAADWFMAAAEHAVQVFAYQEASQLSRRGLSLLDKLPASPERSGQELGLHLVLAFSLAVTEGYGSPDTGRSFSKAREICQQIGKMDLLISALWGEVAYHAIRAELGTARELSDELLLRAESTQDPMMLVGPHFAKGFITYYLGDYVLSHEHFEQAIALHHPDQNLAYRKLYSMDPGIWSCGHTIGTLWALGYREQSRRRIDEALNLAEKASDARGMAYVLVFAAFHYRSRGEPEKVRELAEKCIALCVEHGISHEREAIEVAYGWALAELGQVDEGIALIRNSLKSHNARGSMISTSNYLAVLADSCARAGRIEEAMDSVTKGFEFLKVNNERQCEAELYRLKGELLLTRQADRGSPPSGLILADAEACFQQAIEAARRQGARSWELVATLSLARLWQRQGKRIEARELLREMYGWFTEGLETSDLRQARELLEELS